MKNILNHIVSGVAKATLFAAPGLAIICGAAHAKEYTGTATVYVQRYDGWGQLQYVHSFSYPVGIFTASPLVSGGRRESNPFSFLITTPTSTYTKEGAFQFHSAVPHSLSSGDLLTQHWQFSYSNGRIEGVKLNSHDSLSVQDNFLNELYMPYGSTGLFSMLNTVKPMDILAGTVISGTVSDTRWEVGISGMSYDQHSYITVRMSATSAPSVTATVPTAGASNAGTVKQNNSASSSQSSTAGSTAATSLFFQNNAGQISMWHMNASGKATGSTMISSSGLGDWRMVGQADMNGDGNADLVFQNGVGQISVWHMNGSGKAIGSAMISSAGLGDWRVSGIADMNGDGNADLVFQNGVGQISVWHMNGSGKATGSAMISSVGLGGWRVAGAADMNGDGRPDLVFQNGAGQISVWHMNGSGKATGSAVISGVGLGDWRVAAIADMNGDGDADLMFQNGAGQISVWHMNGSGKATGSAMISSVGLGDWRLR